MFTIFMTEGGPAFLSFRVTSYSQQLPGVLHFPRFFLHVKTALHQVSNPQSARTTRQGSIKLKRGEASLPITTRISPWHNYMKRSNEALKSMLPPARHSSLPAWQSSLPARHSSLPAWQSSLPARHSSLPAWHSSLPA